MARKIMIAVDEGEESAYALMWCLNNIFSPQFDDTLILIHAQHIPVASGGVYASGFVFTPEVMGAMERHATQVSKGVIDSAKKICGEITGDVKVEAIVERGDAREVICQAADRLGVDLLVMGSHGYGAFKRAFLGSVSNHCAQSVKCPVLIVKKPKLRN